MIPVSVPRPHSGHTRDAYDSLPEYVRTQLTRDEWLWLSDKEKATLERDLTEPDE